MDYEKIGKFIYKLRKEKKLTQRELAEALSVTTQAVSKWERGLGCPDVSLLRPLADYFNISISELLNGEIIDKKEFFEKVDDILMKSFEENKERKRKDRILFSVILLGVIALFYILTMNIYASLRLVLTLIVVGIICYTPIILEKKMKLWHILIPIVIIVGLFSFDYIAVNHLHREPILYYKITEDSMNNNTYKRYDSIFYSAYQCNSNEIYIMDSIKDFPGNYCRSFYETNSLKSSSITSKEGYIYYLAMYYSDNKNYKGNFTIFLEGFDFENLYETDYMKDQQDEERYKTSWKEQWDKLTDEEKYNIKNKLVPHGDADLSLAPKEIQNDLRKISQYLSSKKFVKEIKEENLSDLKLSIITKQEVVELFNKLITSEKQKHYGYEINRKEKEVNGIYYEIVYMLENDKITHVKINIKNNSFELDNDYLKEIENKIVEENSFKIKDKVLIKNEYQDLINMLSNIKIN